ncbi:[4Fe-4S] cluster assembly scaffold protein Mrp (=ApbC) [hydrothermal vent metagenome]|uniref:[4Fe-4S] cluster assembly scaffold protein Mrp (=ApbC) n=1 Tax=hydrothermal vent metagenome TaxID=652676 RepID=A0A3B0YBZ6_9ZZZZ
MSVSQQQIEQAIAKYVDPYLEKDLNSAKAIKGIDINGGEAAIKVVLGFPAQGHYAKITEELTRFVGAVEGVDSVKVDISHDIVAHSVQSSLKPMQGIKNIIAVASGKGGVGKSTTAVNLALALQKEGAKVGILDADIYGPSIPRMLGITDRPESSDGKTLSPMQGHGLQAMSIGFMIDDETPMIWRGPMVTQALEQLLVDTQWKDLDYLVIDLPPGTGDVQLTLAQKVPVSGAVIVTTPQDIALLDARKGLKMFEKVEVPVLGIIENMSVHICSECGHAEPIFGQGGGERMSGDYDVDFLGALPLDITIRTNGDEGTPSVSSDENGTVASIYREIARRTAAKLAAQAKDFSSKFPNIVIENN